MPALASSSAKRWGELRTSTEYWAPRPANLGTRGSSEFTSQRPCHPTEHPASAMPTPTKAFPAVSSEPTPSNPHRQPRNSTLFQSDLPSLRKVPPPSRPSGTPATRPTHRQAARQRKARRGRTSAVRLRTSGGRALPIRREQLLWRSLHRRFFGQRGRILRIGPYFGSHAESQPPRRPGCARTFLMTAGWSKSGNTLRPPRRPQSHCKTLVFQTGPPTPCSQPSLRARRCAPEVPMRFVELVTPLAPRCASRRDQWTPDEARRVLVDAAGRLLGT